MHYKDPNKREAVWDKLCDDDTIAAYKIWFQSQKTMFGKITHMKFGQRAPHLKDRHN